jgi:sugar fermentation stimulation protein A
MTYEKVVAGHFLDRPNRFIAHVEIDGTVETVHVKNTGRCRELLVPGAVVYLADSWGRAGVPNQRKTRYDLVAVEKGKRLINMDSQAPNAAVKEFLAAGELFGSGTLVHPEYTQGDSRFDFALFTPELALLEVKGVTLEREGEVLFPDAPTLRGTKHLRELTAFPGESYVLFVVQMQDVSRFRPNEETDPAFAQALRQAQDAGVHLLAYDCLVTPQSMTLRQPVDVCLAGK